MNPATSPIDRRQATCGGFALIEMLAALTVLALLSAMVAPRWTLSSQTAELKGATMRIAGLLRSDRNAALSSGGDVRTTIDLRLRAIRSGNAPSMVAWPSGTVVRMARPGQQGLSGEGSILFRPDGRSSGGTILLLGAASSYRVVVDEATARVSVSQSLLPRQEERP